MTRHPDKAVVVALGGNLGGPTRVAQRFAEAIESISEQWGQALVSAYYLTAPVGPVQDQPDFVNAVAAWWPEPMPSPEAALALLQALESDHGRERSRAGGARTLDLDLLLHAGELRDQPGLRVPHPRMAERAFVLRPLQELFGDEFQWDASQGPVGTLLALDDVSSQACVRQSLQSPR